MNMSEFEARGEAVSSFDGDPSMRTLQDVRFVGVRYARWSTHLEAFIYDAQQRRRDQLPMFYFRATLCNQPHAVYAYLYYDGGLCLVKSVTHKIKPEYVAKHLSRLDKELLDETLFGVSPTS